MNKKIKRPTKEDIINYYINTTKTQSEAAQYFGMSVSVFARILRDYNLHKNSEMIKQTQYIGVQKSNRKYIKPTKEQLEELYLNQNKTKKEVAELLNCSERQLGRYLSEYNIQKTFEMRSRITKQIADLKKPQMPSIDDIIEYYINTTKTREEAAQYFGVSLTRFSQWLKDLNIHKTTDQLQNTIIEQNIKKYGVKNVTQNSVVQEKIKNTNLNKYGVDNVSKLPEIINKIKNTIYKKYGVNHVLQSAEFKDKIKSNNLLKYGVESPAQRHIQHYDIWNSEEKFTLWLKSQQNKPTIVQISKFFNVCSTSIGRKIHELELEEYVTMFPSRSQYGDEIITELNNLGITNIEINNRTILDGQEIDIYLPDYKFGIEFNGVYYHSDLQPKFQDNGGRSIQHQKKSLLAEEKGIFLFHIFEHEWDSRFTSKKNILDTKGNILNRIKTILGLNSITIGARKCQIKEVSSEDKIKFLNANHMQGAEKHSRYNLGLYYQNELVACMTFGKSKFKKYDWDLLRFCSKHGINIPGGASKLFTYFVKNYMATGETVVSYNDITKTKGTLYKTLGFEAISVNSPNYWWINLDNYDVRTRYDEQAAGEVERMHNAGYCRVCDCGTRTWLYTKK